MKHAKSKITGNELTYDQLALVKNLKTLLDFSSGYINIDGLNIIFGESQYYLSLFVVSILMFAHYFCYI